MTTRSKMPAKVIAKEHAATGIWSFQLKVADEAFVPAEAGAHIEVELPSGLLRHYSLVHVPHDSSYQIAVLRDASGRGGSREFCDTVVVGDMLTISAPRNNFALEADKASYLLVAGGIGVTPLIAMAETLADRGCDFVFHLCAATPDRIAFLPEIQAAPWSDRVHFHYSGGGAPSPLDMATLIRMTSADTQIYVCGPKRMLDDLAEATRGSLPGRVRTERFAPADVIAADDDEGFDVWTARSRKRLSVGSDVSLLQALKANGIAIDSSCEEGTCGTCVTSVLTGDIVHRDSCLYDDERASGKMMAVCVSRARPGTELVLDI